MSGADEVIHQSMRLKIMAALNASKKMAIEFTRLKEIAPDLQFTERFTWISGQSEVSLDFWWDEWLQDYRIISIAPCPCRD